MIYAVIFAWTLLCCSITQTVQSPPEKQEIVYAVLANKQWRCSYDITEVAENMSLKSDKGRVVKMYKKPRSKENFMRAKQCTDTGLKQVEQAIILRPNYMSAWAVKTNLLLEAIKISEMGGKKKQKAQYERQYNEAKARFEQLSKEYKQ